MSTPESRAKLAALIEEMDKIAPVFEDMMECNSKLLSHLYPWVERMERAQFRKERAERRAAGIPSPEPEVLSTMCQPLEDPDNSRNVIIRGIPEHPQETTVKRRIERLELLMKKWFGLECGFDKAIRTGRAKPNRMILATFKDLEMKKQVLARKKELMHFPGAGKIYIDDDIWDQKERSFRRLQMQCRRMPK